MANTFARGNANFPPIIAFGTVEKADKNIKSAVEDYDYTTQMNNTPMYCGSDKYATYCAKNYGGIIFKEWREVCDDAHEK